ncbi:AFG2-interacting ribosome maturation factor-like [Ptychodera flava]|uniref:AFG2-interacting ribosome maturation factor-like n=1 Tax=Ptychodera flava TaxID=63121 RepID=UPI00396A52DA
MGMEPETTVRKVIWKACHNLEKQEKTWNKTLEGSSEHVGSLCNLCEQLQCCQRVNVEGTPLRSFTDIKDRLQYKLVHSLEIVIAKLKECLDVLQNVWKGVHNQYNRCIETYHKHAGQLGLEKALERSATEPSIAEMLEWLCDIDRAFTQQYTKRKLLLDLVQYDNQEYMENLSKQWMDSGNLNDLIGNALAHVSFFMADADYTS